MIRKAPGAVTRDYGLTLIISLTVCFLAGACAVWWYYTRQLAAMEEQVTRELTAVSENKVKQIVNWRNERLGDGHVLLVPPVVDASERIISGTGKASDSTLLAEVSQRFEEAFLYTGAVLCDMDGHARLVSGHSATDPGRLRDLARQTIGAHDSQLSDLQLDPQSGRPLMALVLPIRQKGALILDVDPESFLYPYLRAWPGHSQSAETLLMRHEGDFALYLSDLRHHPAAPLRFRRNLKGLTLPSEAEMAAGVSTKGNDYRGEPVIAILRHIPNSTWYVSSKIDAAEADAPEHRMGWEVAAMLGLIGLVNVTAAMIIWRGRDVQVQKEKLEWFHAVANDTPAYLWMADPKMENSFINAPLARFLGTANRELRTAWSAAVHPDDAERARSTFREHMVKQTPYTQEYRIRRYDGEYRLIITQGVPRFSVEGVFLGFAGALLDVTGRRRAEHRLRDANKRLQELSSRLIGAQEEERKRLARELHDDLSQQIAAVSLSIGNMKRQIPKDCADARAHADVIHGKLVDLAEGVRRMSHELHPAVLQYSGLAPALRSYCEEFGALAGLKIELRIEGEFEGVSKDAALCLFRVAQEALRNVAKHARVSEASVELRRAEGALTLRISDQGVGMEMGAGAPKAGLGLLNIQERARLVGGKAEIRSAPGQGTTITVEVPEE
jgi:two-component system sensor histidine kinase UhpB